MDYTSPATAFTMVIWAAHLNRKSHIRRNLSAAACMDYTSPTTARMSEPRTGASCRAVVEISECNSYMSQHLDSLRSDLFLFRCASQITIVKAVPDEVQSIHVATLRFSS